MLPRLENVTYPLVSNISLNVIQFGQLWVASVFRKYDFNLTFKKNPDSKDFEKIGFHFFTLLFLVEKNICIKLTSE